MESSNTDFNTEGQQKVSILDALRSVIEIFKFLIRKWWIILPVTIAAGLLGIYYATIQKPNYESRLTFSLEDNGMGGGLGGALSLAAEFGFSMGGSSGAFSGDNIIEILISRRMIERVLLSADTLNGKPITMADEMIQVCDLREGLLNRPALSGISFPIGQDRKQFSYLQDSVLFIIQKDIVENALVARKPDKKLNLYEVKLTSLNERFSKIFVEILIKETTTFYTELRSKRSKETLEILENRVAALKGSLNAAIDTRAGTQDANINPAFSSAQAPIQRKEADIRVYGGAYGELFKNLELARYQYLKDIPLLQIIDEPNYPMRRIKMGRLYTGIIFSFVAFCLISGIVLMRRYFHQSKKTHGQVVV